MAAFSGQFVPLKITTDGNAEWSKWTRKYRHKGAGIPILYVIRADGKMLYGESGALGGSALPRMMLAALSQSGRRFSDAESALLGSVLEKAKSAYEAGDAAGAALAFGRLGKVGRAGELNSYAAVSLEADELAKTLVGETIAKMEAAEKTLQGDPTKAFDALLFLAQVKDAYGAFPRLPPMATRALRRVKGNSELQSRLTQAEALQRARRFAASDSANIKRKAVAAYQRVIQRYPSTEAEKLAREELTSLQDGKREADDPGRRPVDPTAGQPPTEQPPTKPSGKLRVWTDQTGKFRITARLVSVRDGEVTLRTKEGQLVRVLLERLSAADRKIAQPTTLVK